MIAYPIDCQSEKLEKFRFFHCFYNKLHVIDFIEKNSKKSCLQINVALQPKAFFDVLFRAYYFLKFSFLFANEPNLFQFESQIRHRCTKSAQKQKTDYGYNRFYLLLHSHNKKATCDMIADGLYANAFSRWV